VRRLLGAPLSSAVTSAVSYSQTLKPSQVETHLDHLFFRPAGYLLVRLALPTPLSANGMTLLSILVGSVAGILFAADEQRWLVLGSLLMVLYGVLDCADGQLARARGTSSRLGRVLDGSSDYVVGLLSGSAISYYCWKVMGPEGLLLAAGGLSSILLQCVLFDHFKNRYLRLSGASYREGDDLEETRAQLEQVRRDGPRWQLPFLLAYAWFLSLQALASGRTRIEPTPAYCEAYARRLALAARGWAYLGPSTHVLLLAVFTCTGHLVAYVWFRLVVMNALMALVLGLQYARERQLQPLLG
jgi:CDP-alcohol phosphatidyltransferase